MRNELKWSDRHHKKAVFVHAFWKVSGFYQTGQVDSPNLFAKPHFIDKLENPNALPFYLPVLSISYR